MEGLLPLVYRAVKKSRTRREYQRLRSASSPLINMAEIYPRSSQSHLYQFETPNSTQTVTELYADVAGKDHHHRRHKSIGDFTSTGWFSSSQRHSTSAASKPLVRFRSHRRMFSCITA